MKWETVMGLEVHAELSTKTKIFCGCSTAYGGEPNTRACPVCAGMPGALPALNRAVVECAMRVGLALGCEIARRCRMDRKNYFYPDLPKACQVSQLHSPICLGGRLDIEADGRAKSIGIRQIHMEEDAGKLVHAVGAAAGGITLMDLNRGGVPLLEIVSQPDFRTAGEVVAYLEKLRETLLYLGACDGKMQEGSLRVDVNLSVRPVGGELGVRTEMKNLNSFKAIRRAIECEAARQIEVLEDGGAVEQETRRWDDDKGQSFGMRSKENAQDYRYFPEPDLPPIEISEEWLARVRESLPELAGQKRERYMRGYGLSGYDAAILTAHKKISDLFEAVAGQSGEPKESANLIAGEIMRLMNNANMQPEDLPAIGDGPGGLDPRKLSTLVAMVAGGKISRGAYKETVEAVFSRGADPESYIAERGLAMASDGGAVLDAVRAALAECREAAEDYRSGNAKVFAFLMGQVMKKLGKAGNPGLAKEALEKELGKDLGNV